MGGSFFLFLCTFVLTLVVWEPTQCYASSLIQGATYPMNQSSCTNLGANLGGFYCEWKEKSLEDKFYDYECVPSERYVNTILRLNMSKQLISQCYNENITSIDECLSTSEECLYDVNGSNPGCYYPSLLLLYENTKALVNTNMKLKSVAITQAIDCTQYTTNVSCLANAKGSDCAWDPKGNFSETNIANISETQAVTLEYMVNNVEPNKTKNTIRNIRIEAIPFDNHFLTLTVLPINSEDTTGFSGGDSFRLGLVNSTSISRLINLNASATEVEGAINDMVGEKITENITRKFLHPFLAWVITLRTGAESYRSLIEIVETNAPEFKLQLTRHRRNAQELTINSKHPGLDGGEFLLYFDLKDESGIGRVETGKIPFDASAAKIAQEMLLLKESGLDIFQYIYVEENPIIKSEPSSGVSERRSWIISFSTIVQEYEYQERLLGIATAGDGCIGCSKFTVNGESVNESIVYLEIATIVESPRIKGSFRLELCSFDRVLDGVGFVKVNQETMRVYGENDYNDYSNVPVVGEMLKIGGTINGVSSIVIESEQPNFIGLRYAYTINLIYPYDGYVLQDDYGVDIYRCSKIYSGALNSGTTETQLELALLEMYDEENEMDIDVQLVKGPNELGEVEWDIEFIGQLEESTLINGSFLDLDLGLKVPQLHITLVQSGDSHTVAGSFRLAFAGFETNASASYIPVRLQHLDGKDAKDLSAFFEDTAGCIEKNELFSSMGCMDQDELYSPSDFYLCYTRPIPWDAMAVDVEQAIRDLCNVANTPVDSVRVNRFDESGLRVWEVQLVPYYANEFFLESYIEEFVQFSKLYVISKIELQGPAVDVRTAKIEELDPFSLNASGVEQVFNGDLSEVTPCMINQTYQELYYQSSVVSSLFADLDVSMRICAQGNESYDACRNLSIPSIQEKSFYGAENQFLALNCVWRGDVEATEEFSWGEDVYRGRTYEAINSRCTVPLTEISYVLSQLYFHVDDVEGKDVFQDTYNLGLQFLNCGRVLIFTPQAFLSAEQWYQMVMIGMGISGTCYALAAVRFSFVISDHSLFTPKSFIRIPKLLIFCTLSFFYGAFTAFLYISIPAALISQIYTSENDRENTLRVTASVGCLLAVFYLYFELGRGLIIK